MHGGAFPSPPPDLFLPFLEGGTQLKFCSICFPPLKSFLARGGVYRERPLPPSLSFTVQHMLEMARLIDKEERGGVGGGRKNILYRAYSRKSQKTFFLFSCFIE